jgi:hypothetical protein
MENLMTTLTIVQFVSVMILVAVSLYKIFSITSQVDNIEDYCLMLLIGQKTHTTSWAGESFDERFEIALEKIKDYIIENKMQAQEEEKDIA